MQNGGINMDVSNVSQGGLSTSGLSQTINSKENASVNGNDSPKGNQNNSENKNGITEEQVKNVVEKMNKLMSEDATHVEYELHKGILDAVVKIIDNNTNEVIKQIPAQHVVDAMENLYNSIGMILDKKA